MGGYGSGRQGGYGTTEGAITLDVAECMKLRQLRPWAATSGKVTWRDSRSGAAVASLGYTADMRDPEDAWMRLTYATTFRGERIREDYRIRLETTRPHFGGLRWWFTCPLSYRRVRCLHLAGGSTKFASRQYLRLGYQCQRETWTDQRLRAARRVDAKLGGDGSVSGDPPPKPKWMRWPTYWRLCDRRDRAGLASMVGSMMQLNDPTAQAIIRQTLRDDPDLLAGSGII